MAGGIQKRRAVNGNESVAISYCKATKREYRKMLSFSVNNRRMRYRCVYCFRRDIRTSCKEKAVKSVFCRKLFLIFYRVFYFLFGSTC